jgi:DNA polymerase I-like protein with 3'-5' exonuclease and polymerase domains
MGILAQMEALGVAAEPGCLLAHKQQVLSRIAAINRRALELLGHQVNLASPAQLAQVLYTQLRLKPPTNLSERAAAAALPPSGRAGARPPQQQGLGRLLC